MNDAQRLRLVNIAFGLPADWEYLHIEMDHRRNWPRFHGIPVDPKTCTKFAEGYKLGTLWDDGYADRQAAYREGQRACLESLMQGGRQVSTDVFDLDGNPMGRFHAFFPSGMNEDDIAAHYIAMTEITLAAKNATELDFGDLRFVKTDGTVITKGCSEHGEDMG